MRIELVDARRVLVKKEICYNDDIYTNTFSFDEPGICEVIDCDNKAVEFVNVMIPWKPDEPGKWYLCCKCAKDLH